MTKDSQCSQRPRLGLSRRNERRQRPVPVVSRPIAALQQRSVSQRIAQPLMLARDLLAKKVAAGQELLEGARLTRCLHSIGKGGKAGVANARCQTRHGLTEAVLHPRGLSQIL